MNYEAFMLIVLCFADFLGFGFCFSLLWGTEVDFLFVESGDLVNLAYFLAS